MLQEICLAVIWLNRSQNGKPNEQSKLDLTISAVAFNKLSNRMLDPIKFHAKTRAAYLWDE